MPTNGERSASPSLQPRKKAKSVPKPVLHHLCCVEGMKQLGGASCRLVIADPPYGIGVQGGAEWDRPGDGYMSFAKAWLDEACRILMPGGTLLFFASPCKLWASRMNIMLEDELGMTHMQSCAWCYSQGGDARLENMKSYAVRHEIVEWWTKPGQPTFNAAFGAEMYTEEEKKVALAKGVGRVTEEALDRGRPPRTWVGDIPRENSRSRERQYGKHPAMKPLNLCERFIQVHSNRSDMVVVPFAGSGSELLTAAKLGREAVGYETNDEYVLLMRKRFEGHQVELTTMVYDSE